MCVCVCGGCVVGDGDGVGGVGGGGSLFFTFLNEQVLPFSIPKGIKTTSVANILRVSLIGSHFRCIYQDDLYFLLGDTMYNYRERPQIGQFPINSCVAITSSGINTPRNC